MDLSTLLVVDVESTCWSGDPPKGEISEIIEVGVVVVDLRTLTIDGSPESYFVRPRASTIGPFCTSVTGLGPEDFASSSEFSEVCKYLQTTYSSKNKVWASYGQYDQRMFEQQCVRTGVEHPFSHRHLNVKTLLALSEGWSREIAMDQALRKLGLPPSGRQHRAGDDAFNIARILLHILRRTRSRE